jgi:CheY-like chemotaxis protein
MIEKQPTYQPIQLKVLVAEDNKMNVLILKKFFHNWEIDFRIANNGEELLEIYKQEDFDLILMDLQMPILNGYEATKEIRNLENKNKANVPIIALTAFAQTDIKIKTEQYKMNGFMSKPFKPSELYNLLHTYSVNANAVEK